MQIDEELTEQIVKLLKYYYNRCNTIKYAIGDPMIFSEDFMSIATLYCLEHFNYYDAERAKLSTFIRMLFVNNMYLWINMANYGHSYSEARAFYKIQKQQAKNNDGKVIPTPIVPYSYDDTFTGNENDKNDKVSIIDVIADPESENGFDDIVNKAAYDEAIEYIKNADKLSKNQRKYLISYLELQNLQNVADTFGVTKQAVSGAIIRAAERLKDAPIIKCCCNKD